MLLADGQVLLRLFERVSQLVALLVLRDELGLELLDALVLVLDDLVLLIILVHLLLSTVDVADAPVHNVLPSLDSLDLLLEYFFLDGDLLLVLVILELPLLSDNLEVVPSLHYRILGEFGDPLFDVLLELDVIDLVVERLRLDMDRLLFHRYLLLARR